MVDRAVPNLPSRDFDETVAFYRGFGFGLAYRDGGWLILRRGTVALEFFLMPEADPYSSAAMCSVRVADLDGLYAEIRAAGVPERLTGIPRLVPVALQEWGMRAGFLVDLDGTQLHLIEDASADGGPGVAVDAAGAGRGASGAGDAGRGVLTHDSGESRRRSVASGAGPEPGGADEIDAVRDALPERGGRVGRVGHAG